MQGLEPADLAVVQLRRVVRIEAEVGNAAEQFLQGDLELDAGQVRPDAAVRAHAMPPTIPIRRTSPMKRSTAMIHSRKPRTMT